MERAALVGIPLYTLARYSGMGEAPAALRRAGVVSAIGGAKDNGDIDIPILKKDTSDGSTMNFPHFEQSSARIYERMKEVNADRIFVIGGECSLAPGAFAGLSEVYSGRAGMVWLDAHGDFNTPETSPSGYIGGMCLAMACGRGPPLSLESEQRSHPLAEERLVHAGSRALDPPEILAFNSSPAKLFTAQQIKKSGASEVADEAARHLANRSDWIVCHLDVDVVDPSLIPAVNYPTTGGLTIEEATTVIRALYKTEKMKVLEVTAYNPALDRDGDSARAIARLIGDAQS